MANNAFNIMQDMVTRPKTFWERWFVTVMCYIRNFIPRHMSYELEQLPNNPSDLKPVEINKTRCRSILPRGVLINNNPISHDAVPETTRYPIATMANMGNTCFLNSIIYALRFTPNFVHNIHHLVNEIADLNLWHQQNNPNASFMEELLDQSSVIAVQSFHELFKGLHVFETTRNLEPYVPIEFLHSIRDLNSAFKANVQQDAHELLTNLLTAINESENFLELLSTNKKYIEDKKPNPNETFFKKFKIWEKKDPTPLAYKCGIEVGFISAEFRIDSTTKLICLKCDRRTEFSEMSFDLQIAVTKKELSTTPDNVYKNACVTTELLTGRNKYSCEGCQQLTHGRREVSFQTLPKVLVIQMKRFSPCLSISGYKKLTCFYPTPLKLACFCHSCLQQYAPTHFYELCSVVLHIGNTLSSGHFISYVRVNEKTTKDVGCISKCCNIKLNKIAVEKMLHKSSGLKQDEGVQGDIWLECDDDRVTPMTNEQMEAKLQYMGHSCETPYLLFFSKIEDPKDSE